MKKEIRVDPVVWLAYLLSIWGGNGLIAATMLLLEQRENARAIKIGCLEVGHDAAALTQKAKGGGNTGVGSTAPFGEEIEEAIRRLIAFMAERKYTLIIFHPNPNMPGIVVVNGQLIKNVDGVEYALRAIGPNSRIQQGDLATEVAKLQLEITSVGEGNTATIVVGGADGE